MYKFFHHPESGAVFAEASDNIGDGIWAECHEIDLDQYLKMVDDPKQLPKDVKGILKNASWAGAPYPDNVIFGDLYFNPQNQFPDGIRIYTSRITDIRSDGVYCSLHSKYFVQFKPGQDPHPHKLQPVKTEKA
jgi:hypothetical protein